MNTLTEADIEYGGTKESLDGECMGDDLQQATSLPKSGLERRRG